MLMIQREKNISNNSTKGKKKRRHKINTGVPYICFVAIMEDKYSDVLLDCFVEFRDTIDPRIIRGELFQRRIISPKRLEEIWSPVRAQSCENILIELIENSPCKIKSFLEILVKDHSFLVEKYHSRFVEKYSSGYGVHRQRKLDIFTEYRKVKTVPLRHKLKLLSHKGEIDKFNSIIRFWEDKWESALSNKCMKKENPCLADMYFMTLDAQLEHRRVVCDRNLIKDEVLFNKVKNITAMTSQPYISYMMYLARHGSAKLLAGVSLDESIKEVEEALSRFELIPACRETGIVLYILFNMVSSRYEKGPTESERTFLLKTASEAIDHFGREDENMAEDFKRMVLTKIALVNLGIGVFGNQIPGIIVTNENKEKANEILKEIQENYWDKMEVRWKMFFYIAKTRVYELDGNISKAFNSISKAMELSVRGNFKGEGLNIKKQ
ncbi:uncharacterized protein LOC133182638, partial [Saccostrea echinata]|uniref:uncharacterized protein LOC133182638 n=1 Tax=Saccostrea echinata TaxID=191078 RepID=UPI002A7F4551